jgi:hypothetical protein
VATAAVDVEAADDASDASVCADVSSVGVCELDRIDPAIAVTWSTPVAIVSIWVVSVVLFVERSEGDIDELDEFCTWVDVEPCADWLDCCDCCDEESKEVVSSA